MKIKLGAVPYVYPVPIVLVGADVDGKANFETIGDVAILGINPALVVVSSGKGHHTNRGILANQTYSINFPTTQMLAKVDYCGMASGREADKAALFEVFYGELGNAPLITECPVNLECKVVKEFAIEHRQMFVAEVVQAHINAEFVREVDGRKVIADLTQLDPILYALDNRYYKVGEAVGVGYQEGKSLQ